MIANIITEIQGLIKDTKNNNNIPDLIDINMRITGLLVFFAEEESVTLKDKLVAYNERKEWEANYIISSTEGVTKAEKQAITKSKKQRDREIETEVSYQKARSFRSQVNEFCQALVQKIAALRKEHETTKYQQG